MLGVPTAFSSGEPNGGWGQGHQPQLMDTQTQTQTQTPTQTMSGGPKSGEGVPSHFTRTGLSEAAGTARDPKKLGPGSTVRKPS